METLIEGCSVVACSGHLMALPTLLRFSTKLFMVFPRISLGG